MGTPVSFSAPPGETEPEPGRGPLSAKAVPRVPLRRRWWLLALSVALAAAGALSGYLVIAAADERAEVLVAARDVAWGARLTDADLTTAMLTPDAAVPMIPAAERSRVVGQTVMAALPAGSVLAPGYLAEQPVPGPGELVVGLRGEPGALPARGLRAGDLVEVVPVAETSPGASSAEVSTSEAGFQARVTGVGAPDAQGAVTVDVVVAAAMEERAAIAAAGRVVFVLVGPEG